MINKLVSLMLVKYHTLKLEVYNYRLGGPDQAKIAAKFDLDDMVKLLENLTRDVRNFCPVEYLTIEIEDLEKALKDLKK